MAPPLDTEAQFKFLIACIKHSTAGKIDFGQVAQECEIVSKGAAAKRYERLMKTHGITNTGGGGGAASSGPSTPARKAQTNGRTSTAKKRKLASTGEDLDEKVKNEIKDEIKQEGTADGSYILNPSDPPNNVPTAANALVAITTPGDPAHGDGVDDDEVLVVSESRREYASPAAAAAGPSVFVQQMHLMPAPPANFYGFVDHMSRLHGVQQQQQQQQQQQHAMATTSAAPPVAHEHEHDADHRMQTTRMASEQQQHVAGHWLHHQNPVFFWSNGARLESPDDTHHG